MRGPRRCLQDAAKRHTLDRKQVTEVVCALCDTRQPVAASCSSCGVQFGRYACLKCNFFDDTTSKQQFHCDDCGICRVGGRSNFFHCATCNCCYNTSLQGSHVCVSNSMHQVGVQGVGGQAATAGDNGVGVFCLSTAAACSSW